MTRRLRTPPKAQSGGKNCHRGKDFFWWTGGARYRLSSRGHIIWRRGVYGGSVATGNDRASSCVGRRRSAGLDRAGATSAPRTMPPGRPFSAKRASGNVAAGGGPCAGGLSAPRRCRSVGLAASCAFLCRLGHHDAANPAGSRAPAFCGEARADAGSDRSGEGRRSVLEAVTGTHRTRRGAE